MTTDLHHKKWAYFIPNTFTALNMATGFYSVVLSFRGDFYLASMILILGAIFDSVDGRVARMTGTQSSFGEQFDSLSDVISFGIAPAILIYNKFFYNLGKLGMVTSFIFVLCGALRLARFNANIEKVSSHFFQGLPIPSAALAIIGLTLFSIEYPIVNEFRYVIVFYTFFFSYLMVSNIPFNSFKKSSWVQSHKKQVLLAIFIIMALTFTYEHIMIGGVILVYVVLSILYFLKNYQTMKTFFQAKDGLEFEQD